MSDNIKTHQRFIKKMINDMNACYENEQYSDFIQRFSKAKHIHQLDVKLTEKFYESLLNTGAYNQLIDYSLNEMNEGNGDYELNMFYLLKGLIKANRFLEAIEFSKHLLGENIPQKFRMDINALRREAVQRIQELSNNNSNELNNQSDGCIIDKKSFIKMPTESKLAFLKEISNRSNISYREFMREMLNMRLSEMVKTFILLYLKDIQDDEPIRLNKVDKHLEVLPKSLPSIDEIEFKTEVADKVLSHIEDKIPSLYDAAQSLLYSHMLISYPIVTEIESKNMIDAYLNEIYNMVNLDYEQPVDESALKWIKSIESKLKVDL